MRVYVLEEYDGDTWTTAIDEGVFHTFVEAKMERENYLHSWIHIEHGDVRIGQYDLTKRKAKRGAKR